jgi:hypothetical protein
MSPSIMGRVIRFRGGGHREVNEVLPWYLAGQLDPAVTERVEAHLSVCAECQAEVRFQRRLGAEIAQLPLDVEESWAQMRRLIEQEPAPRRRQSRAPRVEPRRLRPPQALAAAIRVAPVWGGWATAAAMLIAAVILLPASGPVGAYRALGARPAATPGNVLVMFRPETREQSLREALRAAHARLVDGPTAADAYVLSVAAPERARALALLRKRPEVVLAQPIDSRSADSKPADSGPSR